MKPASAVQRTISLNPYEHATGPNPVAMSNFMDEFLDLAKSFDESIARRAFQLFQVRGGDNGSDLDDWFRAETELFHAAHIQVAESEDALAVWVEVPGFRASELKVALEMGRLAITGKRQSRNRRRSSKVIYSDACQDQIFRVFHLPVDVDAKNATAVVMDGILELTIPKFALPRKALILTDSGWIVRASDYQLWRKALTRPRADRGEQKHLRSQHR
ncbi:MAG TPA: Hsp20 family protein [Candidatus Binatus sp.]|jgi:HSP20 family protein|nr:Hsp20 family protein [Candidatus Binatus sp.]